MTKNEFIQRTMIALAGNRAFADMESSMIMRNAIIRETNRLVNMAEEDCEVVFDTEHECDLELKGVIFEAFGQVNDNLMDIKETLNDIRKGTDCIGDE